MKPAAAKFDVEEARRHFLRVSNHNFHDATLEQIRVVPARSKRSRARIEVLLSFSHVELLFSLTFTGCTNVSLALDFDVLEDNLDVNTARFSSLSDVKEVRQFITSQVPAWYTTYDDIGSESGGCRKWCQSPLKAKLARAASLKLHRVRYYGGELSVVATSHKIRRLEFNRNARNA